SLRTLASRSGFRNRPTGPRPPIGRHVVGHGSLRSPSPFGDALLGHSETAGRAAANRPFRVRGRARQLAGKAWMLNFWFAWLLQSQMSIMAPLAVVPPGTSRQRPVSTFLKKKAPVGASAEMVHCWLARPGWQSLITSAVPLVVPPFLRSMHLEVLAVIPIRQLAPSGSSVKRWAIPFHDAYC